MSTNAKKRKSEDIERAQLYFKELEKKEALKKSQFAAAVASSTAQPSSARPAPAEERRKSTIKRTVPRPVSAVPAVARRKKDTQTDDDDQSHASSVALLTTTTTSLRDKSTPRTKASIAAAKRASLVHHVARSPRKISKSSVDRTAERVRTMDHRDSEDSEDEQVLDVDDYSEKNESDEVQSTERNKC